MATTTNHLNAAAHHVAAMLRIGALRETDAATPDAGSAPSFNVIPAIAGNGLHVWRVHREGEYLDTFMTDSGARHAARMLNSGACSVNPHAPVGCRILPAGLPPHAPMHGMAGSGA